MWPQVKCTDGVQRECLVPLASLLNHSADAHIRQYGAVDAATARLELRLGKPCAAGEQLFLSYGALPNLALLLFYGFALPENPHDTVSLTLEVKHAACNGQKPITWMAGWNSMQLMRKPCRCRTMSSLTAVQQPLSGTEARWNTA